MRFPAYPDYRNSGIEWAIELPAHWRAVSLKWVSRIYAGGTPDKNKTHYWEDGSIPWLNSGAVNQVLITEPSSYITNEAFKSSSAKWIPADSLVIALAGQGKTKGMVAQLAIEATCNQSMAAIISDSSVVPRYLFWWLSSNYQNIRNMAGGDLRDGLNLELIGNIAAPVPTEAEQTQIACFLDHETARIDALIEEQRRLIELLNEKRQAVISHAVTKGLDPTVPMKDSGVEWLGEVPVHWSVSRLKFVSTIIDCKNRTPEYVDDGEYLVVRTSNVKNQALSLDGGLYTDEANYRIWTQRGVPPAGSILFTREAPAGEVCLVPEAVPLCLGQRMMNIIPHDLGCTAFLFDFFTSDCLVRYIESVAHGSTVSHLRVEQIYDIPVAIPPLGEQVQIDELVSELKRKYSGLISEANHAVLLLHERRSALISAAVTGKIDVRDWQPPVSVQAPTLEIEAV